MKKFNLGGKINFQRNNRSVQQKVSSPEPEKKKASFKLPDPFGNARRKKEEREAEERRRQEELLRLEMERRQKEAEAEKKKGIIIASAVGMITVGFLGLTALSPEPEKTVSRNAAETVETTQEPVRESTPVPTPISTPVPTQTPEPTPDSIAYTIEVDKDSYTWRCSPNESFDPMDVIMISDGTNQYTLEELPDVTVIASTQSVDLSQVGEHPVTYTVTYNDEEGNEISKDHVKRFRVIDITAPVILVAKANVDIYAGDEYDPRSNIISVTDDAEGEAKYFGTESAGRNSGRAWYTVDSKLDNQVPGTYTVSLRAADRNNNGSSESFTVTVYEKPKVNNYVQDSSTYSGGYEYAEVTNNYSSGIHYVLNNNKYTFHYSDCRAANRIAAGNRQDYYGSRDTLISQGYHPCGICNP